MRRRRFVKTLLALPVAPALAAQQPAPSSNQTPLPATTPPPQASAESVPLETTISDVTSEMVPRFFTTQQFASLRQLSGILMPSINGAPGALEAHTPEFLDFLIGQSPPERQQLYRAGLEALHTQAKKRFNKAFAEVDASQAAELLAALREPWTPEPPADPLARFLRAAKQDVRTATVNSPELSATGAASNLRRPGVFNQYWYPID